MNNFVSPRIDAARFLASSTTFFDVPAGARVALIYEGSAAFPRNTLFSEIAISRGPDSLGSVSPEEIAPPPAIKIAPGTEELNRVLLRPGERAASVSQTWKRLPRLERPPRDALSLRGLPGLLRLRRTFEYRTNGLDVLATACLGLERPRLCNRWTLYMLEQLLADVRSGTDRLLLSGFAPPTNPSDSLPVGMYLRQQAVAALEKAIGARGITPGVLQYVAMVLVGGYSGMYSPVGDGSGWFADTEIPDERSLSLPFLGETLVGPPRTPDRQGTLVSIGAI